MAELLSAGVFIEERKARQQEIGAVSTSTFATVGWTERGPANQAVLTTSLEQFFDTFGTYTKHSDLALATTAFFMNDGARSYIVRVVPSDATKAACSYTGLWSLLAMSEGAWGNLVRMKISGNSNYYTVATASYSRFDVEIQEESADGAGDFVAKETWEALSLNDTDDPNYILKVVNDESVRVVMTAIAPSGGIPTSLQSTAITAESVGTGSGSQQTFIKTLAAPEVAIQTLIIKKNGTQVATDDGEGLLSGTGVSGTIEYTTGALSVYFSSPPAGGQSITADYYQSGAASADCELTGGSDGSPGNIGRSQISNPALVATKKGLYALNDVEEMLNIAIPDFAGDSTISLDLLSYCEDRKDCFAILATPKDYTPQQALKYKQQVLADLSSHGAMYYPWVVVADPLNDGRSKTMSPVGHVAGVYARTDTQKNVGKAPAGVEDGALNFVIGLERVLSRGEMDLIYPANINPVWSSVATGRVVWGARTLAITGDFTQVNARRLFIFLEKSVFNSTHDLVFENVGPELWGRIKLRVDGFLNVRFLDRYFKGTTVEEAYRVICDETNNPTSVQLARQVIVDVLVAVNEPGEFLRFRFSRLFE